MKAPYNLSRLLTMGLILTIASFSISAPARADIVPTSELLAQERLESTRRQLDDLLLQDEVATMLSSLGVDTLSARDRVESLTTAELAALSEKMHELPAGEGALGTIAMVLVILILLDIAGVTDIFPAV